MLIGALASWYSWAPSIFDAMTLSQLLRWRRRMILMRTLERRQAGEQLTGALARVASMMRGRR